MEIFNLKDENDFVEAVSIASDYLQRGKIIVYPTDTIYGFGCDAKNREAIEAIRKLKMREQEKPFSVIMKDITEIKKYVILNKIRENFLQRVFPGKFTVILTSKNKFPVELTGGGKTLGVRIPNYRLTNHIAEKFGKPYVTTSVNVSTEKPEIRGEEIIRKYQRRLPRPDLVINADELIQKDGELMASTVIDLTKEKPQIIRMGIMKPKALLKLLKAW